MKPLGTWPARALMLATAALIIFSASASAAAYEQGFESLAASGWSKVDLSESPGISWSQGESSGAWGAHSGTPDSFVNSSLYTEDHHAAQSDWLISPKFNSLSNGDLVSLQVRAQVVIFKLLYTTESFEVRVSTNGECSPGSTPDSVGDFGTRLLSIDTGTYASTFTGPTPHYASPEWRTLEVAMRGLPDGDNSGCIAIRHATTDQWGASPLVGVDDFKFEDRAPAPGEIALLDPLPPAAGTDSSLVVRGRADVGSTVKVFTDSECAGEPRVLSADSFQWPGFYVSGEPDEHVRAYVRITQSDGTESGCKSLGVDYFWDKSAPVTTDDVSPANAYPGPVNLTATDAGGVAKTYYAVVYVNDYPGSGFQVYDPFNPPVLEPGQQIAYYSVDVFGHQEYLRFSQAAPKSSVTDPPTGSVGAAGSGEGKIRLSAGSLRVKHGRVLIRLSCAGPRSATGCTGWVGVQPATLPRSESATAIKYSLAAGTHAQISLPLRAATRRYLAHRHRTSPWAKVTIEPDGSGAAQAFRRKLKN